MYTIGAMPEPERGHYEAFFAHLDAGWKTVRVLQLVAEALIYGHSPRDDVANWVDVEITDNFRWLAFACLQMIPSVHILAEVRSPFGPEPPVDELEPEAQMIGRNARLLAMMEGSANFPASMRGIVGPAASALTVWELEPSASAESTQTAASHAITTPPAARACPGGVPHPRRPSPGAAG